MGYVTKAHRAVGTEVQLEIRGKAQPALVAELPFVKKSYRR
jgi:aminomethyltransferase